MGEGDILKDFYFDEDEWEWTEGQLAESNIVIAPDTKIAAVSVKETEIQIFFIGSSGEIQLLSATKNGISMRSHPLPPTKPLAGGSLCARKNKDVIHVFYAHQDFSIHDLVLKNGKWKGKFYLFILLREYSMSDPPANPTLIDRNLFLSFSFVSEAKSMK